MLLQASESGEGCVEARQGAAHRVESLALQAVQAVATDEAAPLWLAAFEKAAALGGHCQRLNKALVKQLTLLPIGPLRVSLLGANCHHRQLLYTCVLVLFLWQALACGPKLGSKHDKEHALTAIFPVFSLFL